MGSGHSSSAQNDRFWPRAAGPLSGPSQGIAVIPAAKPRIAENDPIQSFLIARFRLSTSRAAREVFVCLSIAPDSVYCVSRLLRAKKISSDSRATHLSSTFNWSSAFTVTWPDRFWGQGRMCSPKKSNPYEGPNELLPAGSVTVTALDSKPSR